MPEYDERIGKWAAPFIMATINTKNVHRTNFLLGRAYGRDFVYDEMIMTTLGDAGRAMAEAIAKAMVSQGAWRRLFNELHIKRRRCSKLNSKP